MWTKICYLLRRAKRASYFFISVSELYLEFPDVHLWSWWSKGIRMLTSKLSVAKWVENLKKRILLPSALRRSAASLYSWFIFRLPGANPWSCFICVDRAIWTSCVNSANLITCCKVNTHLDWTGKLIRACKTFGGGGGEIWPRIETKTFQNKACDIPCKAIYGTI